MVGVKPAGGIRTSKDAIKYLVMVNEVAGPDWLDPRLVPLRRLHAAQRPADAAHQDDAPAATPAPTTSPWTDHGRQADHRFEYAPAPESRVVVDIKPSYGLFIDGEFVDGHGTSFKTISPATEEVLAEIAEADDADVDARRAGRPPGLHPRLVEDAGRASAASTSSGSPGSSRSARRELAVLESLDNGKPIKESRDVDVPTVAAHFFYYAGWADKLEYAGYGRPAAARRGRPGHPVELPAADAGLEDRARAGLRQHRGAQAGRDHAADRAAVRRDLPAGRPAARRRQHRHRRRRHRAGAGRPPRRRQGRLHRLDRRSARRSRKSVAGTGKKVTLELGGKAANIVFDDAPIDQAVEGIVNGIFFNQGHVCCAGSRLLVQESVADEVLERLKRRMATLRVGDPLDKNTDVGAINSARAARADPRALRGRRGRGRRALVDRLRPARPRASGSRRRSSPASPRRTGSPARRSSARCCRC